MNGLLARPQTKSTAGSPALIHVNFINLVVGANMGKFKQMN